VLLAKLRERNGLRVEPEGLLVGAGATSLLSCAVSAIADPGDEVLVLAPFWPLVRGIVRSQRAVPVEVPFYDRARSAAQAVAAVDARAGARSVALYFSTPSNPTGRVVPADWLEALAAWARRRELWILSDEVYEDYVYRGEHCSIARFAPERTLSIYAFSKSHGMAGNRVGYLAGPPDVVQQAHKVSVHSAYQAPTASQLAALVAARDGAAWVAEARESYRAAGDAAARALGLPAPEGSMFLFVDVADRLGPRGMDGLLERCLGENLLVAPGASCGEDYAAWVRICYSCAPPDQAAEGVRRLARVLGRG
jgi:aspartate/methionine/tyrosine aminotransferase